MPPKLLDYTEKSIQEYWCHRWKVDATGWKMEERHDHFVADSKTQLSAALGADFPFLQERDAIAKMGANALVPLCGDSPMVGFLFKCGFNTTGIEFDDGAARRGIEQLAADGVKIESEEKVEAGTKIVAGDGSAAGNKIQLLVGDFFEHAARTLPANHFDLCYDRAALVALLPPLRAPYVAQMNRLMKTSNRIPGLWNFSSKLPATVCSAIVFRTMYRASNNDPQNGGPPFQLTNKDLTELYPGWRHEVAMTPSEEVIETYKSGFVQGNVVMSRP